MKSKVVYLGHMVDVQGLHTTEKKVEAVPTAPQPRMLLSFVLLGLLHYYSKFLPDLFSVLIPLNQLLKTIANGSGHNNAVKGLQQQKTDSISPCIDTLQPRATT